MPSIKMPGILKKSGHRLGDLLYIFLFCILVAGIGFVSIYRFIDFRVNDQTDRNEFDEERGSKTETDIASSFFLKMQFVNMNGAVRNIFGQEEMNGVWKLRNGKLIGGVMEPAGEPVLQDLADRTAALNDALKTQGKTLLYVVVPDPIGKYDPQLPEGLTDSGNDNADRFVSMLRERDVSCIDLRDTMYEDGIDHYDMFYKTDHHWNTHAGFYAFRKIAAFVKEQTGCQIEERALQNESYAETVYHAWHLGSFGQRTGIYYAGIDDFVLYTPLFETTLYNTETGESGPAPDILYDMEPLENRDLTSRLTYDQVLGRSMFYYWINTTCPNDTRLLVVGDSQSKALNPFLMMTFHQVMTVDKSESSYLTEESIAWMNPDVVILLYSVSVLNDGFNNFDWEF